MDIFWLAGWRRFNRTAIPAVNARTVPIYSATLPIMVIPATVRPVFGASKDWTTALIDNASMVNSCEVLSPSTDPARVVTCTNISYDPGASPLSCSVH